MQAVPLPNGGKQRRNNTVCVDGENRPNDKKNSLNDKNQKCSKSQRCAILTIETFFIGKNRAEFKSFRLFCMLSLDLEI